MTLGVDLRIMSNKSTQPVLCYEKKKKKSEDWETGMVSFEIKRMKLTISKEEQADLHKRKAKQGGGKKEPNT